MAGPNHSRAGTGRNQTESPRREPALIQVQPDPRPTFPRSFLAKPPSPRRQPRPVHPKAGADPYLAERISLWPGSRPSWSAPGPFPLIRRQCHCDRFSTLARPRPGQGRPRPCGSRTLRFGSFYLVSCNSPNFEYSGPLMKGRSVIYCKREQKGKGWKGEGQFSSRLSFF